MPRAALFLCALLMCQAGVTALAQTNTDKAPVEVVATATEYVPHSTTLSYPGHAYTDCHGRTSDFGDFDFHGFENSGLISGSGDISGTTDTNTHCNTTFVPPAQTTLTTYGKLNYTIVKGGQALYLLACTAHWTPSAGTRLRALIAASSREAEETHTGQERAQEVYATGSGHWSGYPAFGIGDTYTLKIHGTSDARLVNSTGGKPKLAAADNDDETNGLKNGRFWSRLPDDAKPYFLIGLLEGWSFRQLRQGSITVKEAKAFWTRARFPAVDVSDMLTSIYRDPENLELPIGWATMACFAVQRGETTRDAVLMALRKALSDELKKPSPHPTNELDPMDVILNSRPK